MQETEQWKMLKLGKFSASNISKLLTGGRRDLTDAELAAREKGDKKTTAATEFGGTAYTYIKEVIKEAMTGVPMAGPTTWQMQWGLDWEPVAAKKFAESTGLDLTYYGTENPQFFEWEDMAGGSPDGLTPKSVVEIKCPDAKFLDYLSISKGFEFGSDKPYDGDPNTWLRDFDYDYYCQVQMNMLCCKRSLCHFVAFDPRIVDEKLQLVVLKIKEDEPLQELIKVKIARATEIVVHQLNVYDQ